MRPQREVRRQSLARLLFAATLIPAPLIAQAADRSTETPAWQFRDSVDVPLVNVDVVVTDKKGRPVGGLRREQFRVLVDGEPVEITNFFERSAAPSAARRQPAAESSGPPVASSHPTDRAGGTDGPLTVVIYLDDSNLHPAFRTPLLRRLGLAIESWRSLDARLLLATFRNRLEILAPPSLDLDAILAAIDELPTGSPRVLYQAEGRRRTIQRMADNDNACRNLPTFCRPCYDNWLDLVSDAGQFAYAEEQRNAVSTAGLADLVSTLAGLPGRKVVLYISDGLPQRPALSTFEYLGNQLCPERVSDAQREMIKYEESSGFNRVTAHANANRVTFYSLDATGLRGGLSTDVSFMTRRYAPSSLNDQVRRMNQQAGIFLLASETGGRMLANANDPVLVLPGVAEELQHGYSLAFMPEVRDTGRVRMIKVELLGGAAKGKRIRYRRSYRDKTLDERLAERLIAAIYLGGSQTSGDGNGGATEPLQAPAAEAGEPPEGDLADVLANPLQARLAFDATTPVERKKHHELTVRVSVPRSAVFSFPASGGGEQPAGSLRIWLAAADQDTGARTGLRQKTVALDPGAEADDGDSYEIAISMDLPEADYWVAVGVRDENTGATSILRQDVTVPR